MCFLWLFCALSLGNDFVYSYYLYQPVCSTMNLHISLFYQDKFSFISCARAFVQVSVKLFQVIAWLCYIWNWTAYGVRKQIRSERGGRIWVPFFRVPQGTWKILVQVSASLWPMASFCSHNSSYCESSFWERWILQNFPTTYRILDFSPLRINLFLKGRHFRNRTWCWNSHHFRKINPSYWSFLYWNSNKQ